MATFMYCDPRTGFPRVGNESKAADVAKRKKEKVGKWVVVATDSLNCSFFCLGCRKVINHPLVSYNPFLIKPWL